MAEVGTVRTLAVGVRALLEVGVLLAVGYWGFTTTEGLLAVALGLGAPLAVAAVWGVFGSPKASRPVGEPWRLLLSLALFTAGAGALVAAGRPVLGAGLGVVAAVDTAVVYRFGWV